MSECQAELCPYWPGEGCMKGVLPCGDGTPRCEHREAATSGYGGHCSRASCPNYMTQQPDLMAFLAARLEWT
jgi:hypothetical protein